MINHFTVTIILATLFGYSLAGYVDPFDVTKVVQNFGSRFQSVVINDVANLTEIVSALENPTNESMVIEDLGHLIEQFDYSYTQFANALQYLIDESEQAINDPGLSLNDVYIPNEALEENIELCNETKTSIEAILSLINDLEANTKVLKAELAETTTHKDLAGLPAELASQLLGAVNQLGDLNGMIGKFMGELADAVANFTVADQWILKKNQILVPIHEYGHIMEILSKICKELQEYFIVLLPKSVVAKKTSSRVYINLAKEFPNAVQVINDVKDLYAMTQGTMTDILQFLKIYGEPINTKPVIPPVPPQVPLSPVTPSQPGFIGLTNPNVPYTPTNPNNPYYDSFGSLSSNSPSWSDTRTDIFNYLGNF